MSIAQYMVSGFWFEHGVLPRRMPETTITYNVEAIDADRLPWVLAAFQQWDVLTGLEFVRVFGPAQITADDAGTIAYELSSVQDGIIQHSLINVGANYNGGDDNGFAQFAFAHEIGHAIGLGHTEYFNGGTPPTFQLGMATWQTSAMAYFSQNYIGLPTEWPLGPKSEDIKAVNLIYFDGHDPLPPVFVQPDNPLVGGWDNGTDPDWYIEQNPDVRAAGVNPRQHYEEFGWSEGRSPNFYFDPAWYLQRYGDVEAAHVNPMEHYNVFGWREGRDPGPLFDTTDYLAANPDVAAAGVNPLEHFMVFSVDLEGPHEQRPAWMVI